MAAAGAGAGAPKGKEEEGEDWLLGYLATTRAGKDPKLNAASAAAAVAAAEQRKEGRKGKGKGQGAGAMGGGSSFTSILGIKRGTARRMSWAAPPKEALQQQQQQQQQQAQGGDAGVAAGGAGAPSEADKKPGGEPAGGQDPSLVSHAHSRLGMLQAGQVYHKDIIEASRAAKASAAAPPGAGSSGAGDADNFHKWAAMSSGEQGSAPGASRRLSSSGGGLRPAGGGAPREGHARRMSTSRISMSGRRQSMDYSELDAVKQRLTHAASLWAVADDEEEETDDEDEEEVEEAEGAAEGSGEASAQSGAASGGASAAATSRGKGFLKMFAKGKG